MNIKYVTPSHLDSSIASQSSIVIMTHLGEKGCSYLGGPASDESTTGNRKRNQCWYSSSAGFALFGLTRSNLSHSMLEVCNERQFGYSSIVLQHQQIHTHTHTHVMCVRSRVDREWFVVVVVVVIVV